MTSCAAVQERLADEGVTLLEIDATVRDHVAGCAECGPFARALGEVDAAMSRLPPMVAPEAALEKTAAAIAIRGVAPPAGDTGGSGDRRLVAALAAVVILAAGLGLVDSVQQEADRLERFPARQLVRLQGNVDSVAQRPAPREGYRFEASRDDAKAQRKREGQTPAEARPLPEAIRGAGVAASAGEEDGAGLAAEREEPPGVDDIIAATPAEPEELPAMEPYLAAQSAPEIHQPPAMEPYTRMESAPEPAKEPRTRSLSKLLPALTDEQRRSLLGNSGRVAGAKDKRDGGGTSLPTRADADVSGPRAVARLYLADRERLTGLASHSPTGYWSNSYVPGDPAIRLLEARLQRWDRSTLTASIGDARLESVARQNWQPFDLPANAALAAYLHADKRAVDGRARLRVQVGLQASRKRSGLRPDMNVGVVLDLRRPIDESTGIKIRALVSALERARQPGDRFSITVAGHPGGLLVAPEDFRHGPIQVAMRSLFAPPGVGRAPAMDLLAAMHAATQNVRGRDDATAPLGASLVLLVSTAPIAQQREALETMAHENAIAGIGLSVVAVGGGADVAAMDRLVLLGQGHRRVLAAADDASTLVDRELHAAGRAVARAVRLRIRLAPGVELVDVLGSENLSAKAAQRVREAEQSIDRRMARNLGIRADRGKDEEGIQIVIPSFFAGDSHTVLLDVVVPGPGPVADVSVRYKDLVYKRNGVARAQLAIAEGRRAPGPLERNVLKNQLAHELASAAASAAEQLAMGDRAAAERTLGAVRDLIAGMQAEIPGWENDEELRADETLLTQYLTVLGRRFAGPQRGHLADSLRYLAYRRLIPPHD